MGRSVRVGETMKKRSNETEEMGEVQRLERGC